MTNSQNNNEPNNIHLEELDNIEKLRITARFYRYLPQEKPLYQTSKAQNSITDVLKMFALFFLLSYYCNIILISYHLLNNNSGKKELLAGNSNANMKLLIMLFRRMKAILLL